MLNTLVSLPRMAFEIHNLTATGLFAPSAGQQLRDEQRRRRSQFDRGTSLAEQEEFGRLEYPPFAGSHPRSCRWSRPLTKIENTEQ